MANQSVWTAIGLLVRREGWEACRAETVRIIVVDVLGFLDGVEEPDGTYTNAFVAIHDDADLTLGVEDAYPVEQFVIVPCGTSGPLLLQQLCGCDDGWVGCHCCGLMESTNPDRIVDCKHILPPELVFTLNWIVFQRPLLMRL